MNITNIRGKKYFSFVIDASGIILFKQRRGGSDSLNFTNTDL